MSEVHITGLVPVLVTFFLLMSLPSPGVGQQGQMLPRRVEGDLPVVVSGVPEATIVAPSDPDMRPVADDLATSLRERTGVNVPLAEDKSVVGAEGRTMREEFRNKHLILVGNALNNRAILPLYGRWLDASDARYPGGDGYELRTLVNPYGTNRQELILGASTPAGARRGLEALKAKLTEAVKGRDLVLPQMLEVQVGPELKPTFDQAIAEVKANPQRPVGPVLTNGHLAEFCNDALRYAWTGEVAFAQRARGVLLEMNRRFDGYYHGDVRTCDDYALEYAVRGWMMLQHAGVLSQEELLETDRNLLHDVPFAAHGPGNVGSRHWASGSMAFFLLVDGLLTYGNPDEAARKTLTAWREGVRAYFRGACRTYRGDVDQAQDFGAMENVFRYALHDGYWGYFDSGWANKTVTQMLMNVDNFGSYSGVGGYGEAMPGSLHYPLAVGLPLRITAFVERRGDLRWICENVPGMGGLFLGFIVLGIHNFDLGPAVPAVPPKGVLTGLTVLPLDDYHYELGQKSEITEGVGPITVPREHCVDKVMFRGGFGRQDPYLLLNGYQSTGMGCVDGNSIVRFCDRGEVWLFQSTQEEGHYTKNAVWVSNGRNTNLLEGCAKLVHSADLGPVCFCSTNLPRYHGTDWERTIFWRRGAAFVVFDRITVKEPAPYVMACTWRSPRYAKLQPDGTWQARTESATFTVRPEADGQPGDWECENTRDSTQILTPAHPHTHTPTHPYTFPTYQLTNSMDDDRFSAEVPWTLRQWKRPPPGEDYKAGQAVSFHNVLFVSTHDDTQDYSLRRLNDRAALLRGSRRTSRGEEPELSLLAIGSQELAGRLSLEADLCWIGNLDLSLVGLRQLSVGGRRWMHSDVPVDLSLRPTANGLEGLVEASKDSQMALMLPGLTEGAVEGHAPVTATDGTVRLSIPPGRHTLTCRAAGAAALQSLEEIVGSFWKTLQPAPRRATRSRMPVRQDRLPLQSVWTYDGLHNRYRTARGLTVSSSVDGGKPRPGPLAILGDTFNTAQASWTASRVEVTLSLPERTRIRGLGVTLFVGAVDFNKTKPDPSKVAEIAVSDDGFKKDVRTVQRPVVRSFHYRRPFYGGSFYSEVVDRVDGLDEPAMAVRLSLERPEGVPNIRLGRVQVLTDGVPDSVPLRCLAVKLNESDAWAVWSPESGRLCLLGKSGKELWRRDIGAAITGVACDDVDGDGKNELAVTSTDWYLSLLNAEGKELLQRDFRGLYESTGGKYYYGACPHGVGLYSRPGQAAKEMAVGHYYFLSYLKADGTITKTVEGTACFWQDFLNTGIDLNGDGSTELLCYSETPWQGRVPVLAIDGVKQELLFSFGAGNGGARLLRMVKVGEEDCVAFGSHKGCGIYSLTKRAPKWFLAGEVPKDSFFVTDLNGDGLPEMVVGQRDGFLLVVNLQGQVVQQWNVGEEVLAVGVLPGGKSPLVLVSTLHGTRGYDVRGRLIGQTNLVAQRFEPTALKGPQALVALHTDGRVEMLQRK